MSRKSPTTIGTVVVLVIAALLGAALVTSQNGGELLHFYRQMKGQGAQADPLTGQLTPAAMEFQGSWYGMSLVALNGAAARSLPLVEAEQGVAVAGLGRGPSGQRAAQAGVQQGDVIVGVDRQPVRDLPSLFKVVGTLNVGSPVLLDVRRGDQPMTLVLPANSVAQQAAQAEAGEWEAPRAAGPGGQPGAGNWAAGGNGKWGARGNGNPGVGNWQPAAFNGTAPYPGAGHWGAGRHWGQNGAQGVGPNAQWGANPNGQWGAVR